MEDQTSSLLDGDRLNYILMLLIYSGVGSWLVARFTRTRADLLRERRAAIRETLDLLDHMGRLRDRCQSEARKNSVDTMSERLLTETGARIDELNRIAEEETSNPSRHYLILPTPRSPFGVFVSLIFAAAVYVAGSALVVFGVAFFDDKPFSPLSSEADLAWSMKILGFALAMLLLAFLARFFAYRLYNAHTLRMRRAADAT